MELPRGKRIWIHDPDDADSGMILIVDPGTVVKGPAQMLRLKAETLEAAAAQAPEQEVRALEERMDYLPMILIGSRINKPRQLRIVRMSEEASGGTLGGWKDALPEMFPMDQQEVLNRRDSEDLVASLSLLDLASGVI